MDTREKILPRNSTFPSLGKWLIIAGLFDPLTAANAAYISCIAARESGINVLVLVLPSTSANLPVEARAALVAALRCVNRVLIGTLEDVPQPTDRIKLVTDSAFDEQHSRDFVQLVLNRQKAAF